LSGLVSENIFQFSRWDLQTTYWSTTAYALFPLVIGVPSALFLVRDKRNSYKFLGWGTIAASLIAVTYYESRVGWILLTVFIITLIFSAGFVRGMFITFSLLIIIAGLFGILYGQKFEEKALYYYEDVSRTLDGLYNWDASNSDIDRKVHMEAGILSIKENVTNFMFGYGFRTSGTVISPYLKKLFEERGFPGLSAKVSDDESTEGYTAMLVDTGLVGMLLLIINFILTCCQIVLRKRNPNRLALLMSAVLALLWLPVINMLDITLFYFLIMPSGLLVQLSRYSPASTKSINQRSEVAYGTPDISLNVSAGHA
jgi:O-antigen ligase